MNGIQSTTSKTDLAAMVARLFAIPPIRSAEIVHMPERRTANRMTATLVALPTQIDIDEPTTREAVGAIRMAAHAMASVIERRTGIPTSTADVYDDLRGVLTVYTQHYRRIAARVERDEQATASEKVD